MAQSVGRGVTDFLRGVVTPFSGSRFGESDNRGGGIVAFVEASYTAQPYEAGAVDLVGRVGSALLAT